MIKSKKSPADSHLANSFPYEAFWLKGRRFFLSKLSWRYLSAGKFSSKNSNQDLIVGYECSWPDSYKKLH